jgi:hypothetical protein
MSITNAQTFSFSKYVLAVLLTTLLIVFSGISINNSHAQPIFDQKTLIEYSFAIGYPGPEKGITSNLIVGIVNFFNPYEPLTSNVFIRTLASCLYLISGSLLAWTLKKRYFLGLVWFALFILLMFTSRFPFLWLSSELFAGAFLMLVMWSVVNEHPFVITALFVALFSWAKPDLLLPGFTLGIVLALYHGKGPQNKTLSVLTIILMIAAFVLPGLVLNGSSYLQLSNRSFRSFCQHYADVVSLHQIMRHIPEPWSECQIYITSIFGNAQTMPDIIKANWVGYMDFVFLSLSKSLRKMAAGNLIFLIPLSIVGLWEPHQRKLKMAAISVFVINLGLITMLSFFHVRYQARYYPLALLIAFIGISERKSKNIKLCLWGYLILLLIFQIYQSVSIVTSGYFFPD